MYTKNNRNVSTLCQQISDSHLFKGKGPKWGNLAFATVMHTRRVHFL
jgi:hypothetical protein